MSIKSNDGFISGIDDAYLEGVERWKTKMPPKPEAPKQSNLIACKTCKKEVAKSAKKCPHCGEKLKWGFFEKLIATIVIVPLFLLVVGLLNGPYQAKHDDAEAQVTVRHAIVSLLKDPDSYKELQNKVVNKDGNKVVTIEYTATNSFNARIRGSITGIVSPEGKLIGITKD